jgi:glycine/D-amino acid oxidase-like deaminating enzyme
MEPELFHETWPPAPTIRPAAYADPTLAANSFADAAKRLGVDILLCTTVMALRVGFSGHGFKIAPAVGRIVSELVVDGQCSSYDISIFLHDRFQRGDLHPGGYKYSIVG